MDDNIKNPQDALEWLERHIHEEAEADGEMTNEHAIQLGFIQNMLAKFPRRNFHRFATAEEAAKAWHEREAKDMSEEYCAGCAFDLGVECAKYSVCTIGWLYAEAKEGGANG